MLPPLGARETHRATAYGDILSFTVASLIGEMIAPRLINRMFSPQGVSPRFAQDFPTALALRPSQVKAFAEDTAHMTTARKHVSARHCSLFPPTAALAGDADEIVSYRQAQRLHGDVAGSRLDILCGGPHVVHLSRRSELCAPSTLLLPKLPLPCAARK